MITNTKQTLDEVSRIQYGYSIPSVLAKLRELGRNHKVIVTKYHGSISDIFFCPCSLNYGNYHGNINRM